MNKVKPIITEKSLGLAKDGKYTFEVGRNLNKHQIKNAIEELFGVDVVRVATINIQGETKRNVAGRKRFVQPRKKAIVELKEKQKIDLFEEAKK